MSCYACFKNKRDTAINNSEKKNRVPSIGHDGRQELINWITENSEALPAVVKDAFSHYTLLLEGFSGDKQRLSSILLQLRRALGIIASSEKRKNSGDPIGGMAKPGDAKPKSPRERLLLSLDRYKDLGAWHKSLARRCGLKVKNVRGKLVKLEDIELTAEELAEDAKENDEHIARLSLGDGPKPALESPAQSFMRGGDVRVDEKTTSVSVSPDLLLNEEVVSRLTEERTRYGFVLSLSKTTIAVEKVVVKDEGSSTRIISASTRDIGPPRMDVTWEFLANMTILVSQYAMPFNRLGSLLSVPDKRFTSAMLSRMFCYVARRFVPIYLHNFRQLAKAGILSGDDTSNRVIEFDRFLKAIEIDPKTDPPWLPYATQELAKSTFQKEMNPSLGVLTATELGFESGRKDGTGVKRSLQTTVISGRGEADDPRSYIVFYRSHIGGFGNLLSTCLGQRPAELKNLSVQSDLSTVNLVSDPELSKKFFIELVGCTSHARRPFAIYENDDPDLCFAMLHLFKGLYIYEKGLDLYGRNEENVRAVREVDGNNMWIQIKDLAELIGQKWSRATNLGTAARYILRHYPRLTAYLRNPQISISNDFSERMLRMEKLIEANALFRNSLEGRFALDINRSILQTGIAAQAPLQEYISYVLRASPAEVEANPEAFTALAYSRNNSPPPLN